MAEHLARIIGTEEDRVNCPFFWKIGACRHGDQCSRSHYKPNCSQTLVIRHMYDNPPIAVAIAEGQMVDDEVLDKAADHFEEFYEEVFEELMKYGEIEDMVVCDNIGDHIIGNVYIKYTHEDYAEKAVKELNGRFYAGKPLQIEYTPVTDFREARCRQFVDGQCRRGGYCNFMHIKHVPRSVKRKLYRRMYKKFPEYRKRRRRSDDSDDYHDGHRERGSKDKYKRDRYKENHHNGRRRNRSKSNDYEDEDADRSCKYARRENSIERREKIERWNKEREMKNMLKNNKDNKKEEDEDDNNIKDSKELDTRDD
ncbi:splicing factor U2AF small subunit, putative [Plasmodium relictum]|uniref:Splicing factor U2AF small subunit, putative n=1 Tax=Plasmodium relictum TaxID=85471 RepID=A0A1J1H8Y3_PLARL|nr:splicing factor U2AF small subunit, putative [Plasmodium relictum]CRH00061.1 splicing factor U2AF small subunit, putative [Plasmodium relictum]